MPPESSPMPQREIDAELALSEVGALLESTSAAHLAYTARDGTPRVIPVGYHWSGAEFVISTATTAPKVPALRSHPQVALSIDGGNTPGAATALSVRGHAVVQIVDGVVPEYLAAARQSMDADAADDFERNVRRMYDQMACIAITPTWVRFYDFSAGRMPKFLQDLAATSGMTAEDWAD